MGRYILNFAPTGMVPTKALNPHTPISVSEIVDDVLMAAEFGASIAHLHARDEASGKPIVCPDTYGRIIEQIRRVDREIIICVSLSGRNVPEPELRAAPLYLDGALKPDMGSLTLSSLNFANQASVNAPQTIGYLADTMAHLGISPEIEIFDLGMANFLNTLIRKNRVPEKLYGNVLLGNLFGAQTNFAHIAGVLSGLPPGMHTSFAGLGAFQLPATVLALASGHGIRIGLEDNLWQDADKTTLASNATLLKRITTIASEMGLTPAAATDVRQTLDLLPGHGSYGCRITRDIDRSTQMRRHHG